jgi:hypothetical protein
MSATLTGAPMSHTYDENGCPCPKCGNDVEAKDGVIRWKGEQPIFNAVRHYDVTEFPGFKVNDVGWRCGFCGWEYGFEFSESSFMGTDAVTMKPYRVVLEIPREMVATLQKVWLLWEPEIPRNVGDVLNHLVNCICEGANDPESWQRTWLHLAGIFVEGEDPEKVDDVSVVQNTALRHPIPPQPKEGGQNDG